MYYIGIDVGGTNLKAGLVREDGQILAVERTPLAFENPEQFARTLAQLGQSVLHQAGIPASDVVSAGIGIPGAVAGGDILYTCNIPLRDVPLSRLFRQHLDVPVLLENDANCAAVGEWLCGAGRGTQQFIVVTLGTGVGGGLILNGKLYSGSGMVGEVGHMVIQHGGAPCNCGRRGCWEAYASATALIRQTREAAVQNPQSLLAQVPAEQINGRTVFDAADRGDAAAQRVIDRYCEYIAAGMTDIVNALAPEMILLGGGVSRQGERLLAPIREYIATHCFGQREGAIPVVAAAQLGNDAGIIGAAAL